MALYPHSYSGKGRGDTLSGSLNEILKSETITLNNFNSYITFLLAYNYYKIYESLKECLKDEIVETYWWSGFYQQKGQF